MTALTTAQAQVYERLASDGYLTDGFLPHEMFPARDNFDNGARRTLRRMIETGYFQPTNFEDRHGNRYYKPAPQKLVDAYQAWLAKQPGARIVEPTLSEVEPSGPDEIVSLTSGHALHRYSRFWHLVDAEGTIEVWEDARPDDVQITAVLNTLAPSAPTPTPPAPTAQPAYAKRVGEYDPETKQYPAYVAIDGESEQLIGCAWSAGGADRLCDDYLFHHYADNSTPEVAAAIVAGMSDDQALPSGLMRMPEGDILDTNGMRVNWSEAVPA